ncbi:MAG: ABC transporter substrate-binding protein [Chloroflexi bacterium]|nr:ABC transporter substrate-binding protein [Chloroflexota bacterium]
MLLSNRFAILSTLVLFIVALGAQPIAAQDGFDLPVPREATLVIEDTATPISIFDSFNPRIPSGNWNPNGYRQIGQEYLFYANFATGEIVPWLATGYAYNDDFTEMTLTLRDGVTWNDGEAFNADDILYTVNTILELEALSGARANQIRSATTSVSAPDDLTVVFTLNSPTPRFHYELITIVDGFTIWPEHVWVNEDPLTFQNNPPLSTAPYVLTDALTEQRAFIWERNDAWWGAAEFGLPAPQYVVYRNSSDSVDVGFELYLSGAVDRANSVNWQQMQIAQQQGDQYTYTIDVDPCPRNVYFNNARYPFTITEVRQAINLIMPRDLVANVIWQPPSEPALHPWNNWELTAQYLFDDILAEYDWSQNLDRAAELLDEAGFTVGDDGIRADADGNNMSFQIITNRPVGHEQYQIAQALADEAANLGINMTVRSLNSGAFWDLVGDADYDMASAWLCGAFLDPAAGLYDLDNGDLANAHFESEELRAAQAQITANLPDSEAAMEGYRQALTVLMREVPTMPVVQTAQLMAWNETYWTNFPTDDNLYVQPFTWWGTFYLALQELEAAQ